MSRLQSELPASNATNYHIQDHLIARTAFFPTSANPIINGGIFAGSITSLNSNNEVWERGIELLLEQTVVEAFYNASERGDPPRCHTRTREAILKEIKDWIKTPKHRRRFIMWLSGPAGAGKTAIAQTIAEMCAAEGLLAATFFFFRSAALRNTSSRLIPTISYQLARAIPALRPYIRSAVEHDPSILKQCLASQMKVLIVGPINKALAHSVAFDTEAVLPELVILDGLDECEKEHEQQEILNVLQSFFKDSSLKKLSLIFLVVSRPDFAIRTKFNQVDMASITHGLVLDEKYHPGKDIRTYLYDMFAKIRTSHPKGSCLPQPWPSVAHLKYLVTKSSGQFIYAATVVKYIESPRHDPITRLNIILKLAQGPANDTPFAQLDALYSHILSGVEDLPQVLDILTLIIIQEKNLLKYLWKCNSGDAKAALLDMHALVSFSGAFDGLPTLHHKSLQDFLTDRSRSNIFFVDPRQGHSKAAAFILKNINDPTKVRIAYYEEVDQFNYHCNKGLVTEELTNAMVSFDFTLFLSNLMGTPSTGLDITVFFQCAEKLTSPDFREGLVNQYAMWLLDTIHQYPDPFRSAYLTLVCSPFAHSPSYPHHYIQDILEILIHSFNMSESELRELRKFDGKHLSLIGDLYQAVGPRYMYRVANIIRDLEYAGPCTFTRDKCLQLVCQIVMFLTSSRQSLGVLHIKDKFNVEVPFASSYDGKWPLDPNKFVRLYYSCLKFFQNILRYMFYDPELFSLLQYSIPKWKSKDSPLCKKARNNMVNYSLEYIERFKNGPLDHFQDDFEVNIEHLDETSSAITHNTDTDTSDVVSEVYSECEEKTTNQPGDPVTWSNHCDAQPMVKAIHALESNKICNSHYKVLCDALPSSENDMERSGSRTFSREDNSESVINIRAKVLPCLQKRKLEEGDDYHADSEEDAYERKKLRLRSRKMWEEHLI